MKVFTLVRPCLWAMVGMGIVTFFSTQVSLKASEVASALQFELQLLTDPFNSEVIKNLENKIFEITIGECSLQIPREHLQCVIEAVKGLCTQEKNMTQSACLGWGDIFASLYTSRRFIFEQADLWRLNKTPSAARSKLIRQILLEHSKNISETYELLSPSCSPASDRVCESNRLERFCNNYNQFRLLPTVVCFSLLLRAKLAISSL